MESEPQPGAVVTSSPVREVAVDNEDRGRHEASGQHQLAVRPTTTARMKTGTPIGTEPQPQRTLSLLDTNLSSISSMAESQSQPSEGHSGAEVQGLNKDSEGLEDGEIKSETEEEFRTPSGLVSSFSKESRGSFGGRSSGRKHSRKSSLKQTGGWKDSEKRKSSSSSFTNSKRTEKEKGRDKHQRSAGGREDKKEKSSGRRSTSSIRSHREDLPSSSSKKMRTSGGGFGGDPGSGVGPMDKTGSGADTHFDGRILKSDVICKFYMKGKCKKNKNCNYSHDATPPRKMEVCKFFMKDRCAKKNVCSFLHNEFPCKYYHTGIVCLEGDKCKYSHSPLTSDMKMLLIKHIKTAPIKILGNFPSLTRKALIELINKNEAKHRGEKFEEDGFKDWSQELHEGRGGRDLEPDDEAGGHGADCGPRAGRSGDDGQARSRCRKRPSSSEPLEATRKRQKETQQLQKRGVIAERYEDSRGTGLLPIPLEYRGRPLPSHGKGRGFQHSHPHRGGAGPKRRPLPNQLPSLVSFPIEDGGGAEASENKGEADTCDKINAFLEQMRQQISSERERSAAASSTGSPRQYKTATASPGASFGQNPAVNEIRTSTSTDALGGGHGPGPDVTQATPDHLKAMATVKEFFLKMAKASGVDPNSLLSPAAADTEGQQMLTTATPAGAGAVGGGGAAPPAQDPILRMITTLPFNTPKPAVSRWEKLIQARQENQEDDGDRSPPL